MTKEGLLAQADRLKQEADTLLQGHGLLELLSQYGGVKIGGVYALGLMAHGDIDIHTTLKDFNKEHVIKILNIFIQEDKFWGYYYGDYIQTPKDGFPKGYYIGINKMYHGTYWKLDIWFIDKPYGEQDVIMANVKNKLTEESRYEILKRKQERNEKCEKPTGLEIYKDVLKF